MWRRFKVTEDEDKHSRKVIASCVRAGAATSSRTERRNMEQSMLNIYYICIFSISITFPPACLPSCPCIFTICKKVISLKTAYFPIVTAPPAFYKKEWKQNWCLSPPRKTRLWSIFIRHNNSNKQNVLDEIIHNDATRNCTKIVENIFIICKLFF